MTARASRAAAAAIVTLAAFTDLLVYSIAVPVLPDLSQRLGASPTTIGLLFSSFGVTLLLVSVPMGAISDRVGRRLPLAGGLAALAVSTVIFAYAERLSWLFAARLVQGAADAITWVVGFALIADLYQPAERGRVMGLVMAGSNAGFMFGPSIGGWLYETGGMRLPFLMAAALAGATSVACLWLRLPPPVVAAERLPLASVAREPAIVICVLVVAVAASTIAMLEPVFSLFLSSTLASSPARIGLLFGVAAVASTVLHPLYGRLADRWGARRLTIAGLVATAAALPLLGRAATFESAVALFVVQAAAISLVVTPSLAYMAEVISSAGSSSFGVAFGLYNFAWGIGLLAGPAIGGFAYERLGFGPLTIAWAPLVIAVTVLLAGSPAPRAAPRAV